MKRPPLHRRLARSRSALIGLALAGAMFALGFAGLFAPKEKFDEQHRRDAAGEFLRHPLPPGEAGFLFGTDADGRDLAWRVLRGATFTLSAGVAAVVVALLLGVPLGLISGYKGGWFDALAMRSMDLLLAFPPLLLALALVTVLDAKSVPFVAALADWGVDTTLLNAVVAIGLVYAPHFARVIRSTTLQARSMDYILACEVAGCTDARIIFRHILPNTISPIVVLATTTLSSAILEIAALSFLGLAAATEPEWGRMMAEAKNYWQQDPHTIVFPGLALSIAVFGVNLLGDGLRDALDVRLKG